MPLSRASTGGGGGGGGSDIPFTDVTNYVPTYPNVGGSALSNVTVGAAWYTKIGSMVFVQLALTADITTGNGSAYVSLPVAAVLSDRPVGNFLYAGASVINGLAYLQDANTIKLYNPSIGSASGSLFWVTLIYRAAS